MFIPGEMCCIHFFLRLFLTVCRIKKHILYVQLLRPSHKISPCVVSHKRVTPCSLYFMLLFNFSNICYVVSVPLLLSMQSPFDSVGLLLFLQLGRSINPTWSLQSPPQRVPWSVVINVRQLTSKQAEQHIECKSACAAVTIRVLHNWSHCSNRLNAIV